MEEDKPVKYKKKRKEKETRWHKLDNTAKIFPVIASESLSNVYRISATLTEKINPQLLQESLEIVLPWFDIFHVRLRRGVFWYYFETNKKIPKVEAEATYPCRYIDPYSNNQYLFHVTYYENRINLEVFHALTDGLGAITFLKELTYQYLRLSHEELGKSVKDNPSVDCSFNTEDSYLKNYKKTEKKGYKTHKAYQLKGELLPPTTMGVLHGYIDIPSLKKVCRQKEVSITQYLTAVLIWGIYKEYLNEQPSQNPICINVPVNLRQFFQSTTMKNFFAVLLIQYKANEEEVVFDDILKLVITNFNEQLTKKNLEKLISYNVSSEKNWFIRPIPLFLKNIGIKYIYSSSTKSFTTTLTNVGSISILPIYKPYIEQFHVILGASKKQTVKCSMCSYDETLVITFSSVLRDVSVQKAFFRKLAQDGIDVSIESNGVYYEEM